MLDLRPFAVYGRLISLALVTGLWCTSASAQIYVNADAAPGGDGSSWATAFNDLQTALGAADPSTQLWIASGLYLPAAPGNTSASFELNAQIELYGGFVGNETELGQRDPQLNPTYLSGDLLGNDNANPATRTDNSFRILNCSQATAARVDGFIISGGQAQNNGGGLAITSSCTIIVANCRFLDNAADDDGGAIRNQGQLTLLDSDLSGNHAGGDGGAIDCEPTASADIAGCTFSDNSADGNGGAFNNKGDLNLKGSTFANNTCGLRGGAMYNNPTSETLIANCQFTGNNSGTGAGGLYNKSPLTLVNTEFRSNTSQGPGGGLSNRPPGVVDVTNCLFEDNEAASGGAIYAADPVSLNLCSVGGNRATSGIGGGIAGLAGIEVTARSTVLWGNTASVGSTENAQIASASGSRNVDFCVVEGLDALAGDGNIGADPLFANLDAGDLRLLPGSSAIDAGDTSALPADSGDIDGDGDTTELLPLDGTGNPRVVDDPFTPDTGLPVDGLVVDVGYFEFQGAIDNDCNMNGIPDDVEVAEGLAPDCNNNGLPDDCDIIECNDDPACDDCNANDIPDSCDLASGELTDTNEDGIPDECTQFDGGCDDSPNWSCVDNWNLNGEFPNNNDATSFDVQLDATDYVFLDLTVVVDSLAIIDNAILNVTQFGEGIGDLSTEGPNGLLVESVMQVAHTRGVKVTGGGPIVIKSGGVYRKSPDIAANTTAVLEGTSMLIGPGGRLEMTDDMGVRIRGDLVLQGPPPNDCPGCGGETPPIVDNPDGGGLAVGGDVILDGTVGMEVGSISPFEVGGHFMNQAGGAAAATLIDFSHAYILLNGADLQTFEVGGVDTGATLGGFTGDGGTNYSVGTIEITTPESAAPPVDVRFENMYENLVEVGPCSEALYVHTLILRDGVTIELADVNVYYETLIDEGAEVITTGCGALIELPACETDADCDDGGSCFVDRCDAGTCVFIPATSFCSDTDGDGIRDDNCVFQVCSGDDCAATPIVFGDMGGQFGSCLPDGTSDGNDRFQALNCFANSGPGGSGINLCEPDAPAAFNVDTGGQFGSCAADGVCDGNDAFAALNAFGNTTTCSCPLDGPAPQFDPPAVKTVAAALTLRPSTRGVARGGLLEIDVLLSTPLDDLRGYQLHVEASGGYGGHLQLVDIAVQNGSVFEDDGLDTPTWSAFNLETGQMLVGMDESGRSVAPGYLATFTFRASKDASGRFSVEILADPTDSAQRTFLFPTTPSDMITVAPVKPVIVTITR